ncbi:uncharacterized protein LOC131929423 [Physella acuta]|uniref:uncharacterized protein LOC131929423 n=1 Tax=Physella acuta TaxID=109671 RepID=UPI0027DD90A5|nr:uncharacterized protein LOC131929423 [Physella acuta]XP_059141612.1 uncharacterized protein LOC131929423 [Physella acuta]
MLLNIINDVSVRDVFVKKTITRNSRQTKTLKTSPVDVMVKDAGPGRNVGLKRATVEERFSMPDHTLLYHGTSSENAASILTYGIDLNSGKPKQNFSHKDGFYLYHDFKHALRWAHKKHEDDYAVIVFRVPNPLLDREANNGLDLRDYKDSEVLEKWKTVVRLCRTGSLYMPEWREFESFSFIQGPICINHRDMIKRNRPPRYFFLHRKVSQQLCVRTESYAEQFGDISNICSVIFYVD